MCAPPPQAPGGANADDRDSAGIRVDRHRMRIRAALSQRARGLWHGACDIRGSRRRAPDVVLASRAAGSILMQPEYLLEARDITHEYPAWRNRASSAPALSAVENVSFGILRGEIFGLIGETGSGKSTL